jgi:hypothetical protein
MSLLCPASSNILTLHDEDLENLRHAFSDVRKLVERRININLGCNFTVNGPGNSNCKLEVTVWNNGTTDLCGSCSFCRLLAKSMQRNVESDGPVRDTWHLSSNVGPTKLSRPLNMQLNARFEKLEYLKDSTPMIPWGANEGGPLSPKAFNGVYLLLLTGHLLLHTNPGEEPKRVNVVLAFDLFGDENDPVVKLLKVHRRPLSGECLSTQNVAKMRDWIKDCDERHDRCWADLKHLNYMASTEATSFLPERMVDIGDALNDKPPRLVITSEMSSSPSRDKTIKYMALSYCWGPIDEKSKLLKTTHNTLRSRKEKIELDAMPRVFQEAVTVAQKLNIQYLWIDSLCIIQDDIRDWQIESSRMADIFSNAYLTLVAGSALSCNDSFLSRDRPGVSCTVPLKITSEVRIEGQFSLRLRRRWATSGSDKMGEISGSRWVTRGWTFQEERLARRVLMFGESKFFLDCRTFERSEDTDMLKLRPAWVTSLVKIATVDQGFNGENTEIASSGDNWQTLCSHYAYRELTFPEDKLPAISGIASNIAKKVQSDYLAGLWRNNLVHDLFWKTVTVATKPKKYRAPSWSWASIDGRINWPFWRASSTCSKCILYWTLLDAQTTPVGLDPYGAVRDGFLKVRGTLEEVKVTQLSRGWSQNSWRLTYNEEEIGYVNLDIESKDIQLHWRENTYQAILVAKCEGREDGETPIRGLLLEKNGRKRENHDEFERVGTFTLFSSVIPGQDGSLGVFSDKKEEQVIVIA